MRRSQGVARLLKRPAPVASTDSTVDLRRPRIQLSEPLGDGPSIAARLLGQYGDKLLGLAPADLALRLEHPLLLLEPRLLLLAVRGNGIQGIPQQKRVGPHLPNAVDHESLERLSGDRSHRAFRPPTTVHPRAGVVPVRLPAGRGDRGGHHGSAGDAPDEPAQQEPVLVASARRSVAAPLAQHLAHAGEQVVIHDALLLATVNLAPVLNLADVGHVGQQLAHRRLFPPAAFMARAAARHPGLRTPAPTVQRLDDTQERALLPAPTARPRPAPGCARRSA